VPQEATEPEQSWESEEEVDYYYPQTTKGDITLLAITIVHEIPHSRVDLTRVDDKDGISSEELSLNPEADVFHPMRNQDENTPEEETENLPAERNLLVEKDFPVDPGV